MENATSVTRRGDVVEQLHDQLQESLQELVTSEDWQRALAVAARFHDYSFANTRLIWAQSAARGFTPSRVAGYRKWQEMGRQVKRGEKGLQILAPIIRNVAPEDSVEDERRVVGYRVVHVFDQSQTDGRPLPEVNPELVEGELPAHWDQVTRLIADAGFRTQVADHARLGEANGVTDWQQHDVVVRAGMPGAQRFKTAVHELAHIRLHEPTSEERPACRGVVEVEAESVAYMVCAALGIDSANYSLPYVATWSGGDVAKVSATANRVIGCARTVLTELEQTRELEHQPQTPTRGREEPDPTRQEDLVRSELGKVLDSAARFYQEQLKTQRGRTATEFLHSRGVDDDSVEVWSIGYAPASWGPLTAHLLKKGVTEELMIEAGVVGRARTGRLYDRMRNRIVFPISDPSGRTRGFAGRLLGGTGPKYLNSPETELYQKRSLLYGLHLADKQIRDAGRATVVEGYLDVIACHQAGLTNVVATAGTALTPDHLDTLDRLAKDVTLAFDGDQAGRLAASRTAELADGHVMRLRVAHLPEGQDPADLLQRDPAGLERALEEAVPIEHVLIAERVRSHDLDTHEGVARAVHRANEVLAGIKDRDDHDRAVKLIATLVGRDATVIRQYLNDPSVPRARRDRVREQGLGIA